MAGIEKAGSHGDAWHSSVRRPSSISSEEKNEKPAEIEAIRTDTRRSRRSRSRRSNRSSRASDGSDPLSPLELALSNRSQGFPDVVQVRTTTSIGSSASRPPDFEVVFDDDDPENPRNWPLWYRGWVIFAISYTTWVVVFYSTSYTASIPGLLEEFNTTNTTVATLGVTTYLLGLAAGSLLVAPASELFGRRPVAVFGAVMVSNAAGTVVDVSTEEYRALTMSLWSIAPMNGPVTGPVIGGFVYQYLGWRWDNWLVLILAGAGTICMVLTNETYAPNILQGKASRIRKETNDQRWWSRYDEKISTMSLLKINLLRPFELAFKEPILWFFNLWISLFYGILYLCFVAYPIVFTQYRGWGPGISGLAFLGIGIGTMAAICAEPFWRKLINMHPKDPVTGKVPPEATARVMIIGAVLVPVGQLAFSWTCLPETIHWAVPIAFGIPFGAGNALSFIYGVNYLAGAYGIYAASALAGNAVTRSFFGGTLPLAGPAMYAALTPQWAGTLLGLLEVVMIPIPVVFYRYGEKIRAKSPVIRRMREDQEKNERRAEKTQQRKAKLANATNNSGVVEETNVGADVGVGPTESKDKSAV
ncbi:hypothetical protein DL768_008590 [Monosporascus sp. mg162]|nr:hypothetical protein DL768_008590 [Monosporascus sp. mg162]